MEYAVKSASNSFNDNEYHTNKLQDNTSHPVPSKQMNTDSTTCSHRLTLWINHGPENKFHRYVSVCTWCHEVSICTYSIHTYSNCILAKCKNNVDCIFWLPKVAPTLFFVGYTKIHLPYIILQNTYHDKMLYSITTHHLDNAFHLWNCIFFHFVLKCPSCV